MVIIQVSIGSEAAVVPVNVKDQVLLVVIVVLVAVVHHHLEFLQNLLL